MAEVLNIPQHKLWGTWPSGVNLERFSPLQDTPKWSQDLETINLIYVGALDYARNIMELCQAVEIANQNERRFVLDLVGYGRQSKELEEFAIKTNGQVRVHPPVPHNEVPEWLAKAHVGVLPFPDEKKFQVSSPIKLFEYLGAGLSILATKISCHIDVIGNGDYVFWAENASVESLQSALDKIWDQRATLQEKGCSAAFAAKNWTWRNSAEKLKVALENGIKKNTKVYLEN
jgi:glycosyltransferase involved in cell wall biosynthesis